MTSENWTELSFKTFALGSILADLPGESPSMREARIQTHKLSRMVDKHFEHYKGLTWIGALARAPKKKWKKAEGKEAQLVGVQAKRVHIQSDKVFKEFLRTDKPRLTNADYRIWREQFDLGIEDSARKYMEIVNKRGALFGEQGLIKDRRKCSRSIGTFSRVTVRRVP